MVFPVPAAQAFGLRAVYNAEDADGGGTSGGDAVALYPLMVVLGCCGGGGPGLGSGPGHGGSGPGFGGGGPGFGGGGFGGGGTPSGGLFYIYLYYFTQPSQPVGPTAPGIPQRQFEPGSDESSPAIDIAIGTNTAGPVLTIEQGLPEMANVAVVGSLLRAYRQACEDYGDNSPQAERARQRWEDAKHGNLH